MIWSAIAVALPIVLVLLLVWWGRREGWTLSLMHGVVDVGRSFLALLFVPVVCVMLAAMVLLMWRGGWGPATESQRIDYFGTVLVILALLIGLGIVWLQRREIPTIRIRGPGGLSADISEGDHEVEVEQRQDGVTTRMSPPPQE